ncbi:hypothetical protein [Azohydromonas aeria]|uniref:hypothetical protein n=1 Tax=Azohydromonas aeria TaxID=2590212 RepID=UPI0012FCEEE7|nr:hypothetical protein [Azohydromonas aeria]
MSQQQGNDDNPRGTVPRNPPRGAGQDQAQATAPQAPQHGGVDSGTDASRGTPGVAGEQHGDPSASNRPDDQGRHQRG